MDDLTKLPMLTGSSVDAHIAVRALTTEQRQDLLRFAQSVLPEGHQLKHRIDEILNKTRPPGPTVDEGLAAEIYETVVEVWREVETLKGAKGRESARIVEGYRHTYVAKLDNALAHRFIAEQKLNDLKNAFAAAHERHPDFTAWLYINELPNQEGQAPCSSCSWPGVPPGWWREWAVRSPGNTGLKYSSGIYLELTPARSISISIRPAAVNDRLSKGSRT